MEKIKIDIKFKGIDSWNRPVFKSEFGVPGFEHLSAQVNVYFGSVNTLFPDKEIAPNNTPEEISAYFKKHIEELEYFGTSFDCEPHGGLGSHVELTIIN